MKYFMAAVVVGILIMAPLGSYLYLKSGYDYRLKSLGELNPKEVDPLLDTFIHEVLPATQRARLLHFPSSQVNKELDLLKAIDLKITDKTFFEIISFSGQKSDKSDIIYLNSDYRGLPLGKTFVLLDTSGTVRSYYSFDEETGKKIIRHLAVVIPPQKKRKIILKSEK